MIPKEKALKYLEDEGEHWSQPIEEAIDIALEEQLTDIINELLRNGEITATNVIGRYMKTTRGK
jgi:hypothetical protein